MLQGKHIFYIPIYVTENELVTVAGIVILQFKSTNEYAIPYYFDLLNTEESPILNNIIDNFIIPFFKNKVFKSNKNKMKMLNGSDNVLEKKRIPNFSAEFINDMNVDVKSPLFHHQILNTIAAHLMVSLELCPNRSLEMNLKPVENQLWCSFRDESQFLDKILNTVMFVVLNLKLRITE